MGYQRLIKIRDTEKRSWQGAQRPGFVDLAPFWALLLPQVDRDFGLDACDLAQQVRAALPKGWSVVSSLKDRVFRIRTAAESSGETAVSDWVLKIEPRPQGHALRRWLPMASRARRAHGRAHQFRCFGIMAPKPLGFLEHRRWPRRYPCFYWAEFVDAPTLVELRERSFDGNGQSRAGTKRNLAERLGRLMGQMHAERLFHGDLHAGNLLVSSDHIWVLDLEGIRRAPLRSGRARFKNLVRFNRCFLDKSLVARSDRLRFLRHYLWSHADRRQMERILWRRVEHLTMAKLRARGETFY